MNEEFRKRRLLDALEYIDDEYIASAARYKMKIKPHSNEPPVQTVGGSLKKYWKQYLGLVACLLLLAFASPIFSFVAQTINSIAAGWGNVTETLSETDNMYEDYFITEDDLARLNEARFRSKIAEDPKAYSGLDESVLNQMRENKECKFAESVQQAMSRPTQRPGNGGYCYIGKYGECLVFLRLRNSFGIYPDMFVVCHEIDFYSLDKAYENGWITDEDLERIDEFCLNFDYYNGGLS